MITEGSVFDLRISAAQVATIDLLPFVTTPEPGTLVRTPSGTFLTRMIVWENSGEGFRGARVLAVPA